MTRLNFKKKYIPLAKLQKEGFFFLIHLFARDILVMKKLKIKKTQPTVIISVIKVEYWVVIVSLISNFFTNKTSLTNKWISFSRSNLALVVTFLLEIAILTYLV